MFTANYLFVSLIWGSIGVGYIIYGKKQKSWLPMLGGAGMIAASYFAGSAFLMSLICCGLIVTVYLLLKWGYG